jgi:hypothetical protein
MQVEPFARPHRHGRRLDDRGARAVAWMSAEMSSGVASILTMSDFTLPLRSAHITASCEGSAR